MEDFKQKDRDFANAIHDYVNNMCHDDKVVEDEIRKHHRYLQHEEFLLAMHILNALAKNYDDRQTDDRNEYACKSAKKLVKYFADDDFEKVIV